MLARGVPTSRPILFGVQEGAFVAMLAAAMHPERFTKLVRLRRRAHLAAHRGDPVATARRVLRGPGGGVQWHLDHGRRVGIHPGCPPVLRGGLRWRSGGWRRSSRLTIGAGVGHRGDPDVPRGEPAQLLPSIRVPTLVLHRTEDPVESVESGRYLAEHIDGRRAVELPGRDTLPWVGDVDPVLEEFSQRFVTGSTTGAPVPSSWFLATVLFTDIVDSTKRAAALGEDAFRDLVERHHRIVRAELTRHRGLEVDTAGDGFFSYVRGSSLGGRVRARRSATRCAISASRSARESTAARSSRIEGAVRGIRGARGRACFGGGRTRQRCSSRRPSRTWCPAAGSCSKTPASTT